MTSSGGPPTQPQTQQRGPKLGSLFTGAGGLDMAVTEVLGCVTAWHCEVDPAASWLLAHRFPEVPNLGDVTAVDWSRVEPVDVICGGSPCQDVSHAGKRAGMRAGTRSGLWAAMCDAVDVLRPKYVIWENVRGVLSAEADSAMEPCPGCVGDGSGDHLRALGRVLGDLAELGYDCRVRGLRAADVGAPHERFRVFVVAADAACDGWDEGRTESAGLVRGSDAAVRSAATPDTSSARLGEHPGAAPTEEATPDTSSARLGEHPGAAPTEEAGADSGDLATGDRGSRTAVDWGPYRPAIERWERRLGRVAPAPTELGAKGGQRLSARLTEWMMGWPAGWVTDVPGITRNDALRICGNGVVPQQAAAALRSLLNLEEVAA